MSTDAPDVDLSPSDTSSIEINNIDSTTEILGNSVTTEVMDTTETYFNESEFIPAPNSSAVLYNENDLNSTNVDDLLESEYIMFEKFVIMEMVMTSVELIISILAVTKMVRWRKNYRNQMLMQLTLARFIKRIIFVFKYLQEYHRISSSESVENLLACSQFYIDFVIVILVFFFIKHMYNSLIIVLVKISQNNFYKVLMCSWLIPAPITITFGLLMVYNVMTKWLVYLLLCSIFRWPLIFVGTGLYIRIVYRVLAEKIRQFASSLAVVTFLLCLILNVYLFSKDIIELWCLKSFSTQLVSYVSGFLMNLLMLVLYVVLIILHLNTKTQTSKSVLPDFSVAEAKF